MTTLNRVLNFLKSKPGYIKVSPKKVSELLGGAEIWICKDAQRILRSRLDHEELKVPPKVLIYDIETSYNIVSSWRIGYNINLPHGNIITERAIICVSWKWLGEDEVYTVTWNKDQDDKRILKEFIPVMNEADIMVAHNGDRFDLKWIRTRAIKHGITMLPFYQQHDTLKTAKRYFNFNSNRLDYLAKYLGFEGKIKTNYELWDNIILRKCSEALQTMVVYCEEDVRQLEKVYLKLVDWDKPKQHAGVLQGKPNYTSPISGSANLELVKMRTTSAGSKKMIMRDLDSDKTFEMAESKYNKWLKAINNDFR
jgi:hypothetical protein